MSKVDEGGEGINQEENEFNSLLSKIFFVYLFFSHSLLEI